MELLNYLRLVPRPACLACLVLFGATATVRPAPISEEAAPQPISRTVVPYTVAVLDRITIGHSDDTSEAMQVSQDGTIDLGGKTYQVKGLTPSELRSLVRRHGSDVASIQIDEFRPNRFSVVGEVFHQIYSEMSDGPMRVMDAIAAANGFTPLANLRRVKLVRENAGQVEVYELDMREMMKGRQLNQNILLEPGDVITVPRNFL
jgi:polysaccharide biosynthesis/export protein